MYKSKNSLLKLFLITIFILGLLLLIGIFTFIKVEPKSNPTLFVGLFSVSLIAMVQPILFYFSYNQKEKHRKMERMEWMLQGSEFDYLNNKLKYLKEKNDEKKSKRNTGDMDFLMHFSDSIVSKVKEQIDFLADNHGKSTLDMRNEKTSKNSKNYLKDLYSFFYSKYIKNILITINKFKTYKLNSKDEYHIINYFSEGISKYISTVFLPQHYNDFYKKSNGKEIFMKIMLNPKRDEIIFVFSSLLKGEDIFEDRNYSTILSNEIKNEFPNFFKIKSKNFSKFTLNKLGNITTTIESFFNSTVYSEYNNSISYAYIDSDKINNMPTKEHDEYNKKIITFKNDMLSIEKIINFENHYVKLLDNIINNLEDTWLNTFIYFITKDDREKYCKEIFSKQNIIENAISSNYKKNLSEDQYMFWSISRKVDHSFYPLSTKQKEIGMKYPKKFSKTFKDISLEFEEFMLKNNHEILKNDFNFIVKSFPVKIYDLKSKTFEKTIIYSANGYSEELTQTEA